MAQGFNQLQLKKIAEYLMDLSKGSAVAVFTTQALKTAANLTSFVTLLLATVIFLNISLRLYKEIGGNHVFRS